MLWYDIIHFEYKFFEALEQSIPLSLFFLSECKRPKRIESHWLYQQSASSFLVLYLEQFYVGWMDSC